ncbi:MAG: fumarylacetoacetate hydrolase family protein [Bacteroidales bacterium]
MKIICIGRNYADHAREMKGEIPAKPVFFMKPETALVTGNRPFRHPGFSKDVHHEVEVVLRISKRGKNIPEKEAPQYYNKIGLGIDFTARDLQRGMKEKGLPWEIAKAFDHSAPVSKFLPLKRFEDIHRLSFRLDVNGLTVQEGNTSDLIFSFENLIAYISRFVTLQAGDLLFTGTPAGVGPVAKGDRLEAYLGRIKMLNFQVK